MYAKAMARQSGELYNQPAGGEQQRKSVRVKVLRGAAVEESADDDADDDDEMMIMITTMMR